MESYRVIRIPEQDSLSSQPCRVGQVAESAERLGCVPLLSQHDQALALCDSWPGNLRDDKRRHRRGEIPPFALFTVVYTQGVVLTDPLAPAVQQQPSACLLLDPRQFGVTYKEKMRLEPSYRQCATQFSDPRSKPPGLGILVRTLERQDHEHSVVWIDLD
jgi:hypothetical protein